MKMARRATSTLVALAAIAGCTDRDALGPMERPAFDESPAIGLVIPDRYIVMLDPSVQSVRDEITRITIGLQDTEIGLSFERLKGFEAYIPPEELAMIAADGSVRSIEPNLTFEFDPQPVAVTSLVPAMLSVTAGVQEDAPWWLDRIDQREDELDGIFSYPGTGEGVHIYPLGTGIRFDHEDFGGRAIVGADFNTVPNGGLDCNGFGTRLAGLAAGERTGVAKGATLVSVRLGTQCTTNFTIDQFIAAVDWLLGERALFPDRPMLAIAPFSCPLSTPNIVAIEEAHLALVEARIPTIVTSGGGWSAVDSCQQSPQRLPELIVVTGTTQAGQLANTAGYGACVDILAPANSTTAPDASSASGYTSGYLGSTGAALVGGAVAIYLERNPLATPAEVKEWLLENATPDAIPIPTNRPGTPSSLLYLPQQAPAVGVTLVVRGEGADAPVNLNSRGRLQVTLLGSDDFDPSSLVLASVVLGDGSGGGAPVATRPNGSFFVSWEDVDGDGQQDLTLHFSIPVLVGSGHLTSATTALILTGSTTDGTEIEGEALIRVVPPWS